jgi:UDP-glucose 4-epimerase
MQKFTYKLKRSRTMKSYTSMVTGGVGFIGSHLTERLLKVGCKVTVVDNFSSGKLENIQALLDNSSLNLVKEDLKKPVKLEKLVQECEVIFHLAANPEVKVGEIGPRVHFEENILATFNLLEALRKVKMPKIVVFTSTSTVYGEPLQIPTPENYAPLIPISTYGATKLACEALITSYAHTFNHRTLILRLANIIGPKSNHGVIVDFIRKIRANPKRLEILGDGTQEKSYMHITDCIEATMYLTNEFLKNTKKVDTYNIGSCDKITVKEIAKIIAEEMHKSNIQYTFTGGVDGGRGWKGDVKTMQLSINKLLQTGWKPKYTSKQAVKLAAKVLKRNKIPKSTVLQPRGSNVEEQPQNFPCKHTIQRRNRNCLQIL